MLSISVPSMSKITAFSLTHLNKNKTPKAAAAASTVKCQSGSFCRFACLHAALTSGSILRFDAKKISHILIAHGRKKEEPVKEGDPSTRSTF
jgi:hypothetical protein